MKADKLLAEALTEARGVPLLRGRIHLANLLFYPLVLRPLCSKTQSWHVRTAVAVCLVGNFSNIVASLLLHNNQHYAYRSVYKRIDFASVYLLGSSVTFPLEVHYMGADWFIAAAVSVRWTVIFVCVFGFLVFDFNCISKEYRTGCVRILSLTTLYVIYRSVRSGDWAVAFWLSISCSLFYLGSLIYVREWPNPIPEILEYHELFHLVCALAFGAMTLAFRAIMC